MKQNSKPTGGVRLQQLLESGKVPFKGGVYLDTYNQIYNERICGTIKARIDGNCMYFVTQVIENE